MQHRTKGEKIFAWGNLCFLILLSLTCIFPLIHILAISFSSRTSAMSGIVTIFPVDFTLSAYKYILAKSEFLISFMISVQRVFLGVSINMILVILTAYPLSKEVRAFRTRTMYVWIFVFTILFSGGLIPFYMTIRYTGLLDSIWSLVLPVSIPTMVFNIVLLLNFFRQLPKALEEAAFIDGASQWKTLWKIYVPLSIPALATISLFTIVFHWNEWFFGFVLMNNPENYPLSSYLQKVISEQDLVNLRFVEQSELSNISDRTAKAAQIVLAIVPILMVYPFLQRYFVKGIVLGSVKE